MRKSLWVRLAWTAEAAVSSRPAAAWKRKRWRRWSSADHIRGSLGRGAGGAGLLAGEQEVFEVSRVLQNAVPLIRAPVGGHKAHAVEELDRVGAGLEREGLAGESRGDGIAVGVEADQGLAVDAHGPDD